MTRKLDWKWIAIGVLIMVALNIAAGFILAPGLTHETHGFLFSGGTSFEPVGQRPVKPELCRLWFLPYRPAHRITELHV